LGGVGIVSFVSIVALVVDRKISLKNTFSRDIGPGQPQDGRRTGYPLRLYRWMPSTRDTPPGTYPVRDVVEVGLQLADSTMCRRSCVGGATLQPIKNF